MPVESKGLVWITGASSGIGHALGVEYGANGHPVILSGRNEAALNDLHRSIKTKGGTAHVIVCDVRKEVSVNEAAKKIVESVGIPDILINNAGVTVFKGFVETSVEEFDDIINTNLRGSFLTTKSLLHQMIQRRSGIVLNIVSFAAKTTYTESSAYAASKAGMAALMEGLRAEVRDKGIKIVNVFPGAVLTPIWHPKIRTKFGSTMLTPEEVARAIYAVSCQPPSVMVEEVVIRPQAGDINA
jgi:3-oxoacyl-[acyl-carrier protein] reductase